MAQKGPALTGPAFFRHPPFSPRSCSFGIISRICNCFFSSQGCGPAEPWSVVPMGLSFMAHAVPCTAFRAIFSASLRDAPTLYCARRRHRCPESGVSRRPRFSLNIQDEIRDCQRRSNETTVSRFCLSLKRAMVSVIKRGKNHGVYEKVTAGCCTMYPIGIYGHDTG